MRYAKIRDGVCRLCWQPGGKQQGSGISLSQDGRPSRPAAYCCEADCGAAKGLRPECSRAKCPAFESLAFEPGTNRHPGKYWSAKRRRPKCRRANRGANEPLALEPGTVACPPA